MVHATIKCLKQDVIAKRVRQADGTTLYIGNSSALGLIGRYVSFGHENANRNETEIQKRLAELIPMIPFSVFEQAKLNLDHIQIVERGPAETITRKRETGYDHRKKVRKYKLEKVHFTGASLFEVDGACFLFDIDRRELKEKIFNPFLVKLPAPAKSIAAAYTSLKPAAVLEAERKGMTIPRQGEWFFMPVEASLAAKLSTWAKEGKVDRLAHTPTGTLREITLRAGRNRPNQAHGISIENGQPVRGNRVDNWHHVRKTAQSYVTGKVEHSGREHAPLILKGWYVAVPNTATDSFTITGDID
jgi:hypothetical protein